MRWHIVATFASVALMSAGCAQVDSRSATAERPRFDVSTAQHVCGDRMLRPGDYSVAEPGDAGAFIIETDGVVLDANGARFIGATADKQPDRFVGRCIVVRNAKNVTIRNANIEGFKVAIYAEDAPGLTIEDCDVSCNYRQRLKSTPLREDYDDWLSGHENDNNEWLRYGAGIYLLRCDDARVIGNRARDGQNGICLADCDRVRVEGNDMSFMSGWGLALWRSNRCVVFGNRFDYCVRGYSHGVYARGQDSAGILVFEQCCDNLFACNSATHGGDGFFLYAGNETLKKTGEGGCNRNILLHNDFSYAVAIGIEATFSADNCFVRNLVEECTYGVWAGYSRNTYVAFNNFKSCTTGIAIEHGQGNLIRHNAFDACSRGVHLWWDEDVDLQSLPFCQKNDCTSARERVWGNEFYGCETAIDVDRSSEPSVLLNGVRKCGTAIRLRAGVDAAKFDGNTVDGGTIINESNTQLAGMRNDVAAETVLTGDVSLREPSVHGGTLDADEMRQVSHVDGAYFALVASRLLAENPDTASLIMEDVGWTHQPTSATAAAPLGKENIFITEWGPFNHESGEPCLYPDRVVAWNEAASHVLGRGEPFTIRVIDGDVAASAEKAAAPSRITVRPSDAAAQGALPFRVRVDIAGKSLLLSGVLLRASWRVAYYAFPADLDPRSEEDWRQATALQALHVEDHDRLQFDWSTRAPHADVPADRFGIIAETTMRLPAGQWRFRTISDDGVRVYVDGTRVIDNWTWHVPEEDTAIVSLEEGDHLFRVEYFDLVGSAQLLLDLEPAATDSVAPAAE